MRIEKYIKNKNPRQSAKTRVIRVPFSTQSKSPIFVESAPSVQKLRALAPSWQTTKKRCKTEVSQRHLK